jgi:hypothetical protein
MKFLKKIYWIILCLLYCTVNQALGQDFYLAYDAFDQDSYHCIQLRADPVGVAIGRFRMKVCKDMFFIYRADLSVSSDNWKAYQVGMFILQQVATWILLRVSFNAYVENDDAIGSSVGTTLWVSGLLQKTQDNGQHVYFDLHNSNINWCNNCSSDNRLGIGYFGKIQKSEVKSDGQFV